MKRVEAFLFVSWWATTDFAGYRMSSASFHRVLEITCGASVTKSGYGRHIGRVLRFTPSDTGARPAACWSPCQQSAAPTPTKRAPHANIDLGSPRVSSCANKARHPCQHPPRLAACWPPRQQSASPMPTSASGRPMLAPTPTKRAPHANIPPGSPHVGPHANKARPPQTSAPARRMLVPTPTKRAPHANIRLGLPHVGPHANNARPLRQHPPRVAACWPPRQQSASPMPTSASARRMLAPTPTKRAPPRQHPPRLAACWPPRQQGASPMPTSRPGRRMLAPTPTKRAPHANIRPTSPHVGPRANIRPTRPPLVNNSRRLESLNLVGRGVQSPLEDRLKPAGVANGLQLVSPEILVTSRSAVPCLSLAATPAGTVSCSTAGKFQSMS